METQAKLRDAVREWLEMLTRRYDVSSRQLAVKAGLAPSTVYRALEKDGDFVMSMTNVAKIGAAFGEAIPDFGGEPRPAGGLPGFADAEVIPYVGDVAPFPVKPGLNQGIWRITNATLNLDGYKAGDYLLVDMTVKPDPGDIVCAQVYNFQRGTAETVLRRFQPPYLLVRSTDPRIDPKPLYVDGERVVIVGVVIRSMRERAA